MMDSKDKFQSMRVVIYDYWRSGRWSVSNEWQISEVTTDSIAYKKRFLEALGRKLYNRKFSLPPVPNTMNEGIIVTTSTCLVVHENHGNDICLEMLFRLPIYGDMTYENIE